MGFWKPYENYQIIEISSMKKNKKPLNTNANQFHARPLQHYRKQYDTNTSSRYQQQSHAGFYNPGGYIVKSYTAGNLNDCAGHVFSADYMLNKEYNLKFEKRICDGKKLIRQKGSSITDNRQLLYARNKTYLQNMPIKETLKNENYGFSNKTIDCGENDKKADIIRYSKNNNRNYLKTGGVSSSERILRRKYETIKTSAYYTGLSTNSIAMSLAYNTPTISRLTTNTVCNIYPKNKKNKCG
jgi:hypothetical protein